MMKLFMNHGIRMSKLLLVLLTFLSCDQKEYPDSYISVKIEGDGIVKGAGNYQFGKTCILDAKANDNFGFLGWFEHDRLISKEEVLSFTTNKNRNIKAVFSDSLCSIYIFEVNSDYNAFKQKRLNVEKGKTYYFEPTEYPPMSEKSFMVWKTLEKKDITKKSTLEVFADSNKFFYCVYTRF